MKNDFNSSGLDAMATRLIAFDAQYKELVAQAEEQSGDLPKLEDALRAARGRSNEQRAHTLALRIELQSLAEASERAGAGFDEHDTRDELDMRFGEAQERHAELDDAVIDGERRLAQAREKLRSTERQAHEVLVAKHFLRAATTTQRPKDVK